ncbi:hypothetical protein [Isobaculum melis]|nr:hypothetical protein [Isobaculum melis]
MSIENGIGVVSRYRFLFCECTKKIGRIRYIYIASAGLTVAKEKVKC